MTGRTILDRAGSRIDRLLVIGPHIRKRVRGISRVFWRCQCDCGNVIEVISSALGGGHPQSCGCLKPRKAVTHQMTNAPEYRIWAAMIQRCDNPKASRFADYGGRGIKVCERWRSFENFYADMGRRPSDAHSIDRYPNNDGNYDPGNCRWATRSQQQLNKRPNNTENLPRGNDHWTRKDRDRARRIGAENIRKSHGRLEANGNSKMSKETAEQMRAVHAAAPNLTFVQLGAQFGVGRETARKVIRGILW